MDRASWVAVVISFGVVLVMGTVAFIITLPTAPPPVDIRKAQAQYEDEQREAERVASEGCLYYFRGECVTKFVDGPVTCYVKKDSLFCLEVKW